jgi:hypothetical protein
MLPPLGETVVVAVVVVAVVGEQEQGQGQGQGQEEEEEEEEVLARPGVVAGAVALGGPGFGSAGTRPGLRPRPAPPRPPPCH